MKKVMFLMAVAGMFAFAACNNAPAEPETIDTPVVEEVAEEVIDTTMAAVEGAVEEVATEVAE